MARQHTIETDCPELRDALRIGQRVRLLRASRAKLLWDRAGYSAHVEAGAEGAVCGPELLDRDGHLTTSAIQELRGYPGTQAYEVVCMIRRRVVRSGELQEAWVYVTPDALAVVTGDGRRALPHDAETERHLRQIEADEVHWARRAGSSVEGAG